MEKFGVPRRIVAFVMPTGYSFNLDGSTLYLARGVAVRRTGRRRGDDARRPQLVMMLTLLITSKGIAAVPRASLVVLSGALSTYGLPLEGVAVILGVDALMDMARTSVNLRGQLPGVGGDGAGGRARPESGRARPGAARPGGLKPPTPPLSSEGRVAAGGSR